MYNNKHRNLQGVGNPWNGICIVVPNVDYGAYRIGDMSFSKQVDIIKNVFISSTGDVLSKLYILPLIRCNEKISCPLDSNSYYKCLRWFSEDVKKYDFKDIMLLGSAAGRFLNCTITSNLNNIFISRNNRRYSVNYAPFISYLNSDKKEIFEKNLIKWYNSIINEDFSEYEIIKV